MQDANTTPVDQPPVTEQPVTPRPLGSPQTPPPRKKMSKGVLWSIIGGAVALLGALIITLFALYLFGGPSKQEYQDALDASVDTARAYSEYQKGILPRAQMQFQIAMKNVDTAVYNQATEGESKPFQTFDEESLSKIENNEREIARQIVEAEQKLDALASNLDDSQVASKYDEYKALRTKLYGQGRTAEQFVEKQIHVLRFQYGCSILFEDNSENWLITTNDAKKTVILAEGCRAVLKDGIESGALEATDIEIFRGLDEFLAEAVALLRPMIARDDVDQAPLDELSDKYSKKLETIGSSSSSGVTVEKLADSLDSYLDALVQKRNEAKGNLKPQDETRGGAQGVAR